MNKNWFTRKHQEDIDPTYLSNMTKATEYFTGWYKGYFDTSYERMLKRMHHIACANGYRGCVGGKYNRQVDDGYRRFSAAGLILKKEWYTGVVGRSTIRPNVRYLPTCSHWLHVREKGYELHLSDEKFVPRNVGILDMLMDRTQEFDPVLLADYMHVFVVTHPFERVNFSICMAQVNAILDMNGYETLYHEYMDFACFLYDSDIIEKMFVSRLCKKSND